ncbi:small acid-soluble spore protein alpha/beta type [Halothermothrix orenii H 168]|uniref:Small acid-soluble spore protein alpha/beta type n=1 Tax=Halothermothrix orenii (strain H 168 / OCM 544 / DSM 9562) TaxID=373903 RepID=B8CXM1_HALOH|nr:alpha/beta-type small acid-soluble spore protein [Halothermothrix orenii]ACL70040.1 small acid-soluble spore protein alpha/beta type [Halothermothrix orenii H 168]
MARRNNHILNPRAADSLDRFKYETADELGLINKIQRQGWENMTTREVGKIGGNMVRKMIQMAEDKMARRGPGK